ncbi:MAG: histidine triad nucleotide-binding protein [Pseudomonadota bacterium]
MDNCIFCKIVAKKIHSDLLYEDESLLAFKDIRPAAPVHFLVIPKVHVPTLADCGEEYAMLLGKMMTLGAKLAAEQGCGLSTDQAGNLAGGYKAVINIGPDGGQEVYHLHLHVIGGVHPWRNERI